MVRLVAEKTTPRNRDEKEIVGYRDGLNIIHESHDHIPVRSQYILQLHHDLLKHAGLSYGGNGRSSGSYTGYKDAE